jgi:hypothetical protein
MKRFIVEIYLVVSIYLKKNLIFHCFPFSADSTFDITCSHHELILSTTSGPTQTEPIHDDNSGNFNVTIDDLFLASQTSHLSPILQINNIKFQQKIFFLDDDDDELLEAFNKHIQSPSSNQIINPSSSYK